MSRFWIYAALPMVLTACNGLPFLGARTPSAPEPVVVQEGQSASDHVRPVLRPAGDLAGSLPETAPSGVAETGPEKGALGATIVSLGTPAEPGLWLKTPLVDRDQPGRVVVNGREVAVTLRAIEGVPSGGSRLSLAAMQALGLALTDLTEVQVIAG